MQLLIKVLRDLTTAPEDQLNRSLHKDCLCLRRQSTKTDEEIKNLFRKILNSPKDQRSKLIESIMKFAISYG